jgi:hypothetical protein
LGGPAIEIFGLLKQTVLRIATVPKDLTGGLSSRRTLIIAFDDVSFRDLLRPRFGDGLFVGSDQESQNEVDEGDAGESDELGSGHDP